MQGPMQLAFEGLLSQALAASGSAGVFCARLCKPPADRAGPAPGTAQDKPLRQHTEPIVQIPFMHI